MTFRISGGFSGNRVRIGTFLRIGAEGATGTVSLIGSAEFSYTRQQNVCVDTINDATSACDDRAQVDSMALTVKDVGVIVEGVTSDEGLRVSGSLAMAIVTLDVGAGTYTGDKYKAFLIGDVTVAAGTSGLSDDFLGGFDLDVSVTIDRLSVNLSKNGDQTSYLDWSSALDLDGDGTFGEPNDDLVDPGKILKTPQDLSIEIDHLHSVSLSGQASINIDGLIVVEGKFEFRKQTTQRTVTLSDQTSATVRLVTVGASDVNIFVGYNGPASNANAIGLSIENGEFALALLNATPQSYYGIKAKGTAKIIGIPGIGSLNMGDIEIEANSGGQLVTRTIANANAAANSLSLTGGTLVDGEFVKYRTTGTALPGLVKDKTYVLRKSGSTYYLHDPSGITRYVDLCPTPDGGAAPACSAGAGHTLETTRVVDFQQSDLDGDLNGSLSVPTGPGTSQNLDFARKLLQAKLKSGTLTLATLSLDGMDFNLTGLAIALLNDPENVLRGLEGFFGAVDEVAEGLDSVELPLIGGAGFDELASELRGVKISVLGNSSGGNYTDGLGKWLQDAAASGQGVIASVIDSMRQLIYDGFSGINSPYFSLVVPVRVNGVAQFEADGTLKTRVAASADDIELVLTENGLLKFNLKFGGVLVGTRESDGSITPASLPLDFGAGMPGLSIDIDAALEAEISYLMGLGLGIGNVAPAGQAGSFGVMLDTSGINASGHEIVLKARAGLAEGSTASGTLGFLMMDFVDVRSGGSGLTGTLYLDIADGGRDGAWTPGEKLILELGASAQADAELFAKVSTTAGDILPSVSTTIVYHQVLGKVTLSTSGGAKFEMGSPELTLRDVKLDVGSMFESFLGDTFSTIYKIVKPFKPVVDLLLQEVDMGITSFQLIDIAYLRLPAKQVDTAKKILGVIKSTLDFLEKIDGMSSAGEIGFGDFKLTGQALQDKNADPNPTRGGTRSNGLTQSQKNMLKGPDQKGLDSSAKACTESSDSGSSSKKSSSSGSKKSSGSGSQDCEGKQKRFKIPVLEEPKTLVNFLLGRGEATLFWYDLPDLELEFEYERTFPIIGPLSVTFGGKLGAYTNFDFGYDTRGLSQWMEKDFDPAESWRLINGFFLDDHGREDTPQDVDEVMLRGEFAASLQLGIAGIIEAGVKGGLEAMIGFDLNDMTTDFQGNKLVGDGKMYGDEVITRILQGPECLFDVRGELKAFVEAFVWIGLDFGFGEITLFEHIERFVDEVLAEFSWECALAAPKKHAELVPPPSVPGDMNGDGSIDLTDYNMLARDFAAEADADRSDYNALVSSFGLVASDKGGELTLEYEGGQFEQAVFNVAVLPVDDNLTVKQLLKDKYFDSDLMSASETLQLRNKLSGWRTSNAGQEVIVASTGQRVNVFLTSDVKKVVVKGTPKGDVFKFKNLNGRIRDLEVYGFAGDDIIIAYGDVSDPWKGYSLNRLTIDAGPG